MNKQYLIVDLNSDYKELMDYKGIKNLLISAIQEDLLINYGEYDIVKDCSNELVKMAKEEYTSVSWIKDLLESYSYKIIDLLDLQRDLEDCRQYYVPNEEKPLAFDFKNVIETINKGEIKNG